jgi:dTDP-4-amino-4,6-dideoxygalactose transaminase
VIIPSYTFVSTALAFVRQGAKIVFIDSNSKNPNLNTELLESLINPRTKAIVPVHYAGIASDMDTIMKLAEKYKLLVIEDAAQAIDSFYKGKPLGSIGHLASFSFHETKNINSGEGGMLVINDERFIKRAEIVWEKGTNRTEFFRGEVNKYGWVDIGSSFLPSEIIAAYLFAQLENLNEIQTKRKRIWYDYHDGLKVWAEKNKIGLPFIPDYATNNGHMFYLIFNQLAERNSMIEHLKLNGIYAVSHYLSLHMSLFYQLKHDGRELPESDRYTDCLLRLPLFYELSADDVEKIVDCVKSVNLHS